MHDFFVDRVLSPPNLGSLISSIKGRDRRGRGLRYEVPQKDRRGGNAVNLASALTSLGLKTLLITHSDETHRMMLMQPFEGLDVEVRVKPLPPGLTLAFEGDANVMLNDERGVGEFSPSLLEKADWSALRNSELVCSVNWASNRCGTELLIELRKRLQKKTIFLDPADIRDRQAPYSRLLNLIKESALVDWLSLNVPEAVTSAELLGLGARDAKDACSGIAETLGITVDVHGRASSFSSSHGRVFRSPCRKLRTVRTIGAGDVWNGAAIYGHLTGMSDTKRLKFANAAAGVFVSSESSSPPSLARVTAAMR